MGKKISSWKDCTDSRKVERAAKNGGLEIRNTKGSHRIMKDPTTGATQTYYDGDISTGVAVKLFKFFKYVGIASIFIYFYVQYVM